MNPSGSSRRDKGLGASLFCAALLSVALPAHAEDIGRKACMADAKRLCPAAVKALNRKAAEACLFEKIEQTTPKCHDTILLIHKQRTEDRSKSRGHVGTHG